MTRYTVTWLNQALEQLAEIWLRATNRQSITAAADAVDIELAVDPDTKGEAVAPKIRMLVVLPLDVLFSLSEPDRLVEVINVRLYFKPPHSQLNGAAHPPTSPP
jgi:hypothetical protein